MKCINKKCGHYFENKEHTCILKNQQGCDEYIPKNQEKNKMIELPRLKEFKENFTDLTQRNNKISPSTACLPTSCAIAIEYISQIHLESPESQLEDIIVKKTMNLSENEIKILTDQEGSWIFDHDPWTVLPIIQFVLNRDLIPCSVSWGISLAYIKDAIESGKPVVCLGNFSKISHVGGHYNCVVGVDIEKNQVKTIDPFGNGHTNYKDKDGFEMIYDWSIFDRGYKKSYGIKF